MTAISVYYSCYDNSLGHCGGTCLNLTFDANCIFVDPKFVDPDHDDYRLSAGSPCIDDGFNDYNARPTDLDGEPRIFNEIIDMGAFEFQGGPEPETGYFYSVRAIRPELKNTVVSAGQINRAYNC